MDLHGLGIKRTRLLEVAQKAVVERVESTTMMASLEAQLAHLRALLKADDFATRATVIAALAPLQGPLANRPR
jgi:hypothetical protein